MKNLNVARVFRFLSLGIALSFACACSPQSNSSSSTSDADKVNTQRIALVTSDVADFANLTPDQVEDYDSAHAHAFQGLFGGLDGRSVRKYFKPRIKYFVTSYNQIGVTPDVSKLQYQGWLSSFLRSDSGGTDNGAQLGGQNLGTAFWFIGMINNVSVDFILGGQHIPADSSRSGVMLIGDAYASTTRTSDGQTVALPPGYRQAILLHEARHSDCTGGVTEADLDVARSATSSVQFTQTFPKMACGHFHSYCPQSMKDLAGLAACDSLPWGAYSVGFVYQAALSISEQDPIRKAVLEAGALDSFSRLQFDTDAMLSGAYGPPDMSSTGLISGTAK